MRARIWSLDGKLELSGRSARLEDGGASRLSKHKTGGFGGAGWLARGEAGGEEGIPSRPASARVRAGPTPGLEGSAPPCMLRREILELPGGTGRNPHTGLENAFLRLRGHQ